MSLPGWTDEERSMFEQPGTMIQIHAPGNVEVIHHQTEAPRKARAILDAWHGLGDTIYLRPVVRELSKRYDLHISTAWPELLADLDIRFVRPFETVLRVQAENVERQPDARWSERPEDARRIFPHCHWSRHQYAVPTLIAMSLEMDPTALTFDLPSFPRPAAAPDHPYAVVRPATVRKEWANPARNPDPRYIAAAAAELQRRGLAVVSVAHLADGAEWAIEPLPPADVTLHAGELSVTELMGLTQHAAVVVGGVGWIVPSSAAQRVPCLVIGGGHGFYNAPGRIVGPPMDGSRMRFILPDEFCRWCHDMLHACPKEISGFETKLDEALTQLGVP